MSWFANLIRNNKFYIRAFEKNGNKAIPEARLPPMMGGSFAFAAGMFTFGWYVAVYLVKDLLSQTIS